MKISRDKLCDAAECLELVPKVSGILSSQFVLASKSKSGVLLQLSSGEASCDAAVPCDEEWPVKGPVMLDRAAFLSFVQYAKDGKSESEFDVSNIDGKLKIKNGWRQAQMALTEAGASYPRFSGVGKTQIELSEIDRVMVACAITMASNDTSRPELCSVYLDGKGNVYASNAVVVFRGKADYKGEPVALPVLLCGLLNKFSKLFVSGDAIAGLTTSGYIYQGCTEEGAKFPAKDCDRLIEGVEKQHTDSILVPLRLLQDRLKRFAAYTESFRSERSSVVFAMPGDGGHLGAKISGPQGSFVEMVPAKREKGDGSALATHALELLNEPFGALSFLEDKVAFRFGGKSGLTLLQGSKFSALFTSTAK